MDDEQTATTTCERCGGTTVPIVYGYPGPELFDAAERGEVVLGGCMVWEGRPRRQCVRCNRRHAPAAPPEDPPF